MIIFAIVFVVGLALIMLELALWGVMIAGLAFVGLLLFLTVGADAVVTGVIAIAAYAALGWGIFLLARWIYRRVSAHDDREIERKLREQGKL